MPVHQVESYYLCISSVPAELEADIEAAICNEGYRDFFFDDSGLTVDGIESESEGIDLEEKVMAIINGR